MNYTLTITQAPACDNTIIDLVFDGIVLDEYYELQAPEWDWLYGDTPTFINHVEWNKDTQQLHIRSNDYYRDDVYDAVRYYVKKL